MTWKVDGASDAELADLELNTKEAPEYEIRTVGDFLAVPESRLDECLAEFREFLGLARDMVSMSKAMEKLVGVQAENKEVSFVWVDDGKRGRTVEIRYEGSVGKKGAEA